MQALAVGYAMQGFAVWTASGCRIMSSLRHLPRIDSTPSCSASGVVALAWDVSSLRLLLCERGTPGQLMQMHFVRPAGQIAQLSVPGEQRGVAPALTPAEEEVHVLQGDDRLLFVSEAVHNGAGELHTYADPFLCRSFCMTLLICFQCKVTFHNLYVCAHRVCSVSTLQHRLC